MASKSRFTIELLVTAKKAKEQFQSFGRTALAVFSQVKFHIIAATAALTAFTAKAINAYEVQARAEAAAAGQLRALGSARQWDIEYLKEQAALLQDATTINDDLFISAGAVLGTFRNMSRDELPKILELTADMTTIYGGDLVGNAKQLGRVFSGYTDTLSRYGIILSEQQKNWHKFLLDNGKQAEANAYMIDIMNSKIGGAARKFAEENIAAFTKIGNNINDTVEEIGKSITEELAPALNAIADITHDIVANWEFFRDILGDITGLSRDLAFAFEGPFSGASFLRAMANIRHREMIRRQAEENGIMGPPVPAGLGMQPPMGTISGLQGVVGIGGLSVMGYRDLTGKAAARKQAEQARAAVLLGMVGAQINEAPDMNPAEILQRMLDDSTSVLDNFRGEIIASIDIVSDSFTQAIMTGKMNWRNLLNDLVAMFVRSGIEKLLMGIFGLDNKSEGGGGGGWIGAIIGGIGKIIGLGGSTGGGAPIQIVTGDPSSFVQLGRQTITPDNAWRSSLRSRNYSREILPSG